MLSLNQIKKILITFFDAHSVIKTTVYANDFDFNAERNLIYPIANIEYIESNISGVMTNHLYAIHLGDLTDGNVKNINDEIISDLHLVAEDFFTFLQNYKLSMDSFEFKKSTNIQKYLDATHDRVSGITFTVTLAVRRSQNECSIPSDYDYSIGWSGTSGGLTTYSGAGTSGSSGTSGANGSSGTSGANGANGINGTSGVSGTSGMTGVSGTSGSSGSSGAIGTSGTSANGSSGTSGATGTSGAAGSSGTSGVDGAVGTSGANGTSGVDGTSGTSFANVMTTAGDIIYGGASGVATRLADVAVGSYLRSGGVTTAPLWSTLVLPNNSTANRIVFSTSANTYGESPSLSYNASTGQFFHNGSLNTTGTVDTSGHLLWCNSLSSGTGVYIKCSGTAALTNQTGLFVALSGANTTGGQTTYAAQFSNTHTGTSINHAAKFIATGGSTNYAIQLVDGSEGVGKVLTSDASGNGTWASGAAGTSGIDGTSGINGSTGAAGTSGSNGTSGIDGTSGISGSNGSSGTSGIDGTSGASGTSGAAGSSGANGSNGTSGVSGTSGSNGSNGTSGVSGTSGTSGSNGGAGAAGTSGVSGTSGINGTSGVTGGAGTSGTSGSTTRIGTTASSSTPTPDANAVDQYNVTALAAAATFGAPTGSPVDGQPLLIRIKDNGTARALAWNAIYRAGTDAALPTTTVISKTQYVQFVYNAADTKWDTIGLAGGF